MQEIFPKLGEFLADNALQINPAEIIAASASPFQNSHSLPQAVAFPAHPTQYQQLFSLCAQAGINLRFRGGSTSLLPPPDPPTGNWILVKTTNFSRILDFSPEAKRITLQAGVNSMQLGRFLQPHKLELPGLSAHPMATVGGCLALNLLPGDFPQVLPCSSRLLNLVVLTPQAEIITLAPHNGSCGELSPELPLASLYTGSQGCAGLILQATFSLSASQKYQILMFHGSLAELLDNISHLLQQFAEPPALMLLDARSAECAGHGGKPTLLLRCQASACRNLQDSLAGVGIANSLPAESNFPLPHFLATRAQLPDREKSLFVLAGLPENVERMLSAATAIAEAHDLEVSWFGYPGLARMYFIFFYRNREQWQAAARDLFALKLVFAENREIDAALGKTEEEWRRENAKLSRKLLQILDPRGMLSNWRE